MATAVTAATTTAVSTNVVQTVRSAFGRWRPTSRATRVPGATADQVYLAMTLVAR